MRNLELLSYAIYAPLNLFYAAIFAVRSLYRFTERRLPKIVTTVYFWLRPLLPIAFGFYFAANGINDYLYLFLSVLTLYWVANDKDDDEHWKKLKDKLLSKVEVSGSKLVTVPTEA